GKGGYRRPYGSMQCPAQRHAKILIRDRLRSSGVDSAPDVIVIQYIEHDPHELLAVNPREILSAVPSPSSQKYLERRQHLRQCATGLVQDNPDAQPDDA